MKNLCAAAVLCLLAASTASADVIVSTLTPASGLTRGGEVVHIHGSGMFDPPLGCPAPICSWYVNFGTTPAAILDITSTDVVVVAPPHAAGPVDVEVHAPLGGSIILKSGFLYQAPQAIDQQRFLVPVAAGAGTWQVDLSAYNGSSELLTVSAAQIAPFTSKDVTLVPPAGSTGVFVYAPKRIADSITWSLRVHDTARDADGWGVELPVVPESQFRPSVVLSAIPSDSRFRTLLRIYGFSAAGENVQLTLRDEVTGELLVKQTVSLAQGVTTQHDVAPIAPAYTQVALDPLLPKGHTRVRAELVPDGANKPIWAFVSVTNNTTQQVTSVTPAIVTSSSSS